MKPIRYQLRYTNNNLGVVLLFQESMSCQQNTVENSINIETKRNEKTDIFVLNDISKSATLYNYPNQRVDDSSERKLQ